MSGAPWTALELEILRDQYPAGGAAWVQRVLDANGYTRTRASIKHQAMAHGYRAAPTHPAGPSAGRTTTSFGVRLPAALVARLDKRRGSVSRSRYLAQLLEERLA